MGPSAVNGTVVSVSSMVNLLVSVAGDLKKLIDHLYQSMRTCTIFNLTHKHFSKEIFSKAKDAKHTGLRERQIKMLGVYSRL